MPKNPPPKIRTRYPELPAKTPAVEAAPAKPAKTAKPSALKPTKAPQGAKPAKSNRLEEAERPGPGGARRDAGRPRYEDPEKLKDSPLYISMTRQEKAELQAKADQAKMTLSSYAAMKLGCKRSSTSTAQA